MGYEEMFKEKFCSLCGSQRCPADKEAIESCGYNNGEKLAETSQEDKDIRECLDVLNNLEKHTIIIDGKIFFQACVLQAMEKINSILERKT